MKVLISGASGFVGAPLVRALQAEKIEVIALTHSQLDSLREGHVEGSLLEGLNAVIHLAGEPLTLSRWGSKKKKAIFDSRVEGTHALCSTLAAQKRPPQVFISASAIGVYGDRGEEVLTEESSLGTGFLSHVCKEWERASLPLQKIGVRTVQARFGMVLGKNGGVLNKLRSIYQWGLGATLGSGRQWISWVHRDDLVSIIQYVLRTDLNGPINVVSPYPVRQRVFSLTLAKVLHRPHLFKIPASLLRAVFGDVADELLLNSVHAIPNQLIKAGFSFRYASLEEALKDAIH